MTVIKIVSNNLCLELNRGVEFNRYVLLDGSVFSCCGSVWINLHESTSRLLHST